MEKELKEQLPTFEEIAKSIQDIADAMRRIEQTRVSRKMIITLIHAGSKVNKKDIEYVLNNLAQMDNIWLKRLPRKQ